MSHDIGHREHVSRSLNHIGRKCVSRTVKLQGLRQAHKLSRFTKLFSNGR